MKINYASHHQWLKPVTKDPATLYGTKNAKRINSTLARIADFEIKYEIKDLDESFLSWFSPLYIETIGSKENALVRDLYQATLNNESSLSKYQSLTLFENNKPVGGTIIGVRDDIINVAFRTYPNKWEHGTLQANPSLYTEYLISKYAYDLGKKWISHGKDRNPYGINANIGLAIFKLSVGCLPETSSPSTEQTLSMLETDDLQEDALILHYPESGNKISEATLVVCEETRDLYNQVTSYPEQLLIKNIVIYQKDSA